MIKKFFSLFTLICTLLSFVACEMDSDFEFTDKDYDIVIDGVTVFDNNIYYLSTDALWFVDTNDTSIKLMDVPEARFITSNENGVYVYSPGNIYVYNNDEQTLQHTIPNQEISSFTTAGEYIIWTYNSKLYFFNISDKSILEKEPLLGVNPIAFSYSKTQILVLCQEPSGETEIYSFDTSTMSAGEIHIHGEYERLAYNSLDSCIYLYAENDNILDAYNTITGEILRYKPCNEIIDSSYFMISNGSSVIIRTNGTLSTRNNFTIPQDDMITITALTSSDGYGVKRLEEISNTLLNYNINLVIVKDVSLDKLKQKQLAGDSDYDLYFSNSTELVLDYPVYEPLNAYTEIVETFDLYFDEVKDLCYFNETLFGVPSVITVNNYNIMNYNAALLEELNLDVPASSWTLNDFYTLAVNLRQKGYYISPYIPLYLTDYAQKYFDAYDQKELTDDGTILRQLLEITKKLKTEDLLFQSSSSSDMSKVLFSSKTSISSFIFSDEKYCFNPTFDGERSYMLDCTFLLMNINSNNKEAAAITLVEYMKNPGVLNDSYLNSMIFKDTSSYTYPDPQTTNNSTASTNKPHITGVFSDENMNIYLEILANSKINRSYSEWLTFANSEASKYYSDEQDIDTTVTNIINRAKIILEE